MADELTPAMAWLWDRDRLAGRDDKPGLSVERVVRAAVELADADGLEGVSMARVARRLGFTTMSLYRHVASKDELLVLMADTTYGPPPPAEPGIGWRAGLERWARALAEVIFEHPWLLRVPIDGPPTTPGSLAWLEAGLEVLAETRLDEGEKTGVVLLVNGCAWWHARIVTEIAATARERGQSEEDVLAQQGAAFIALAGGDRFPAVRQAIDAGLFAEEDDEDDFAFGLQVTLDGIARLVERRAARAS